MQDRGFEVASSSKDADTGLRERFVRYVASKEGTMTFDLAMRMTVCWLDHHCFSDNRYTKPESVQRIVEALACDETDRVFFSGQTPDDWWAEVSDV